MSDLTSEFEKPARKATRAARSAGRTTKAAAEKVAAEAKAFSGRSAKIVKSGAAKVAKDAETVKSAANDSADIAQNRLRIALESLQQTSEEMSRWAGARAVEAKDKTTKIVQERPFGAVASMFAVGALLGVVAGIALRD